MSSGRKRPQCHSCGTTMQGHTRKGRGKYICPDFSVSVDSCGTEKDRAASEASIVDSVTMRSHSRSTPLPSPPVSPSPSPSPTSVSPPAYTPTFNPPPGDNWHWRNPNWRSPARESINIADSLTRASLAPTEPNTEYQANIQGGHFSYSVTFQAPKQEPDDSNGLWEDGDNDEVGSTHSEYFGEFTPTPLNPASPRSWSPYLGANSFNSTLRESTPLFNVFRTRRTDVPKVTRAAEEEGKHVCVIDAPPHYSGTAKLPREKANGTVWILVSDREDDLRYALDSQQRGMPGTLFPEEHTVKNSGFLDVLFAGLVGGLVVACGFKYL